MIALVATLIATATTSSSFDSCTAPKRKLSPVEACIYHIGVRAKAAGESLAVELKKCAALSALEHTHATKVEQRLIQAPPPAPATEGNGQSVVGLVGAVAGAGLGGFFGAIVGAETFERNPTLGSAIGSSIGAAALGIVGAIAIHVAL